jgi:hypothetical protein
MKGGDRCFIAFVVGRGRLGRDRRHDPVDYGLREGIARGWLTVPAQGQSLQ